MANQTAENGTTVSILGPVVTVAVGGVPSGSKAKTRKHTGRKGHVTSRYLRPKMGSCHDRCKNGVRDEPPELKRHGGRLRVRKVWVKKIKLRRSVEPVERKKTAKTKPKPVPRPKICARNEVTFRKATQNEPKKLKNHVKQKPSSSSIGNGQKNKKEIKKIKNTGMVGKSTSGSSSRKHKPESPRKDEGSMTKAKLKKLLAEKISEMTLQEAENEELEAVPLKDEESMTKTKIKQLVAEKITEMILHEAENKESEAVSPAVEIVDSPIKDEEGMIKTKIMWLVAEKMTEKTLQETENAELESVSPTVTTEATFLPRFESSQSSSDKQISEHENSRSSLDKHVSEEEHETANNEDDDKMVNCEDKENEGSKVKFTRGRVVGESEDDDPRKLKLGRGKIPKDEDDGPTRLKFRRGKILEYRNADDSPTRLKFKEGKILENNEDDGPTRLNFREGKILDNNEDDESIVKMKFKETIVEEAPDECKKESETVTLKHQEMQEKKAAQELLNRVIEETASKLGVDRKTKVEALVGAFESVISLRDDTPSSGS